MKKQILFLAAMLIAMSNVNATQWSVSNSPQNPGQFATLSDAVASASVLTGDTLLVHPTSIAYSTAFTLSKQLTIIGGGFNTNKVGAFYTNISGTITLNVGCSGSRFYGFRFATIISGGTAGVLNNLVFEDCYSSTGNSINFSSAVYPTNLVVKNCIVSEVVLASQPLASAFITNCIFYPGNGVQSSTGNLTVNNCTFIGSTHLNLVSNALIQNCIFQNSGFGTINNTSFTNCLNVNVGSTMPPAGTGNTGSNNMASVTTSPFVNNANGAAFSFTGRDYHTTGASLTASTTGGPIGVYGGTSNFSLTGEPLNSAIIRSFTITNTTVPVNGNLNINLMVTKPVTQ